MRLTRINHETLEVSGLHELCGADSATTRDAIRQELTENYAVLNFDLSQMTFVDSSGLGVLISLQKTMRARGGQMHLVNPSPVCQQLLEMTRLNRNFEIVAA